MQNACRSTVEIRWYSLYRIGSICTAHPSTYDVFVMCTAKSLAKNALEAHCRPFARTHDWTVATGTAQQVSRSATTTMIHYALLRKDTRTLQVIRERLEGP